MEQQTSNAANTISLANTPEPNVAKLWMNNDSGPFLDLT